MVEVVKGLTPHSYAYRFSDPISGNPVWRNYHGEWNGQRPQATIALYTAESVNVALTTAQAQAQAAAQEQRIAELEAENATLRHWSWGHIDALLLYAAGSYPEDSHVKDAVAFCRLLKPAAKLRMDPLKASEFHPARAALGEQQ